MMKKCIFAGAVYCAMPAAAHAGDWFRVTDYPRAALEARASGTVGIAMTSMSRGVLPLHGEQIQPQ